MPSIDIEALLKAINPRVKAVFAESIGNPKLDVADLRAIADVAHAAGGPFVLDNTVSPYLLRPFEHGVDIAVKALGNIAYIIKARVTLLRDLGPALSPFNSFQGPAARDAPLPGCPRSCRAVSSCVVWCCRRPCPRCSSACATA